jgi:hypothetical protein
MREFESVLRVRKGLWRLVLKAGILFWNLDPGMWNLDSGISPALSGFYDAKPLPFTLYMRENSLTAS